MDKVHDGRRSFTEPKTPQVEAAWSIVPTAVPPAARFSSVSRELLRRLVFGCISVSLEALLWHVEN